MKDLFETPELIPANVQQVLESFNEECTNTYHELNRILAEIEPMGYTFDYYLDADPYGLRPVGIELNELEGYESIND